VASAIVLSEGVEGKAEAMFREGCPMGREGIVTKRLGSAYVSGRTGTGWRLKTQASGDEQVSKAYFPFPTYRGFPTPDHI
jgi:ATP-dependent DNA ligase